MTADRLNEIRERAEKATPGPWFYNGYSGVFNRDKPDPRDGLTFDEWADQVDKGHSAERYGACPACGTDRPTGCRYAPEWYRREPGVAFVPAAYGDTAIGLHARDAEFIAQAREDIPYLLAEIERLNGIVEGIRDLNRLQIWSPSLSAYFEEHAPAVLGHNEETTL